jgi:bacterioferritin-associated ferredoxin
MYVCICKAVNQRAVGQAIDQGASTVEAVGQLTGAGTDCGGCHRTIRRELLRAGALRSCDDAQGCSVAEQASPPG